MNIPKKLAIFTTFGGSLASSYGEFAITIVFTFPYTEKFVCSRPLALHKLDNVRTHIFSPIVAQFRSDKILLKFCVQLKCLHDVVKYPNKFIITTYAVVILGLDPWIQTNLVSRCRISSDSGMTRVCA